MPSSPPDPKTQQGSRPPTQADIARAAEVSTATVSRVLNRSPLVRADVRERVEAAIEKLGYFPHGAARALASSRSHTIGAVIPTLNNAIFASGINAFEATLAEQDHTLLLAVSNYSLEAETVQVRRLLERGIDAIMLIGNAHAPQTYEALERAGKTYVNTWNYNPASGHPNVGFSNVAAMEQLAGHLVGLGHKDIGMLAGITTDNDRAKERVEGLRAALSRRGMKLSERSTREIAYSVRGARRAFAETLEDGTLPTALVCGNDVIAMGVLFEARDRGIRIPEELSVTGFDDLPLTAHFRPALTTVHVPAEQMGAAAAEVLLNALGNGAAAESRELEAELLLRDTTAPPRRG